MKRRDIAQPASRHALIVLLVVATLAAVGCGDWSEAESSGSATSPATPTASRPANELTTSQLIADADAVCRRVNRELADAPAHVEAAQIARSASRHAAVERRAVAELAKLTPPPSLARDWRQILAYRRTLAEELVKLGRYAKTNDVRGIRALAGSKKRVHQKLSALARRAGFRDCGRVASARSPRPAPSSPQLVSPIEKA